MTAVIARHVSFAEITFITYSVTFLSFFNRFLQFLHRLKGNSVVCAMCPRFGLAAVRPNHMLNIRRLCAVRCLVRVIMLSSHDARLSDGESLKPASRRCRSTRSRTPRRTRRQCRRRKMMTKPKRKNVKTISAGDKRPLISSQSNLTSTRTKMTTIFMQNSYWL